jgi:glucan endo-1,3-beta-D-glucosidase
LIDAEIAALKAAIEQYPDLGTYVTGISVGSEDLYRISPTGIINKSGVGAQPDELVSYIKQVREAIAGTSLSAVPIGHVETWNDWTNSSNSAVIQAIDWLGVDAYPYYQSTMANSIDNGPQLFYDAFDATTSAAGGKPVWITEVGWPVSGPDSNEAVASLANAEKFWKNVACKYIGNTNLFWYTLSDSVPNTPSPSFGIVGNPLTTTPLYDLSCSSNESSSSSIVVKSTSTVTATSAVETATSSGETSNSVVGSATSVLGPTSTPGAATSTITESSTSNTESPAVTTTAIATGGLTPSEGAGNGVPSSAVYTYTKPTSSIPESFSTVPTGTGGSSVPATAVTASASSGLYGHGSSTNTTVVTPTITSSAVTSAFTGAAATMGPAAFLGGAVGAVVAVMAAL